MNTHILFNTIFLKFKKQKKKPKYLEDYSPSHPLILESIQGRIYKSPVSEHCDYSIFIESSGVRRGAGRMIRLEGFLSNFSNPHYRNGQYFKGTLKRIRKEIKITLATIAGSPCER